MSSREWYEATQLYECPMCLGMYCLRENRRDSQYPHQGEFKVRARIDPGTKATRHSPPTGPDIDEIYGIKVVSDCPHKHSDTVHDALVTQFTSDFHDGRIEAEFHDDYDEPL